MQPIVSVEQKRMRDKRRIDVENATRGNGISALPRQNNSAWNDARNEMKRIVNVVRKKLQKKSKNASTSVSVEVEQHHYPLTTTTAPAPSEPAAPAPAENPPPVQQDESVTAALAPDAQTVAI